MKWSRLGGRVVRAAQLTLCAGVLAAALELAAPASGRAWAQAEPPPSPTAPAAAPTALAPVPTAPAASPRPTANPALGAEPGSPGAPPDTSGASAAGASPGAPAGPSAPSAATPAAAPPAGAGVDATAAAPAAPASVTAASAAPDASAPASAPAAGDTAGPGRVLYADNFANAASGWPVQSSDAATRRVGYANGEYYVTRLPGSGGSPYVMRDERFDDFSLTIDARLVEPTADAYIFVDFRRQESGEHYSFVVAPDEGAFIVRRNTDRDGITVLDWTRSAAIQRGTATNRLGVRAQGGEVTLLVNGDEVGRAPADELRVGGVGFGVGNLSDGPADARFSNLVVTSVD